MKDETEKNRTDKRKRQKIKTFLNSNSGVSPVIAVLLILAITVLMAGYLGVVVLSYEFEEPPPHIMMRAQVKKHNGQDIICIEHRGGESIEIDGLKFTSSEGDINVNQALKGETYEIGKTISIYRSGNRLYANKYPLPKSTSVSQLKKSSDEELNILIVDEKSNQILFEVKR